MSDLAQAVLATFARLDLRSLIDILIVALIIYGLLVLLRGTTAVSVLRGIVFILLLGFALGSILQLSVLNWLLRNSFTLLLVAIPIVFQPELRRGLERIGRPGFGFLGSGSAVQHFLDILMETCLLCSSRRYGALIAIERETGLQEYRDTGVPLQANLTVDLLTSLFYPGSPLHDGAVILREHTILAARCVLPLADSMRAGSHLGTRHRAAIGITERTDAVCLVVSEERGTISLAVDGHITVQPDAARLRRSLEALFGPPPLPALLGLGRKAG